jgi:hypothetical protein
VLLSAEEQPDGTIVLLDPRPVPCTRCGAVPDQVIELVEQVVEVVGR